MTVVGDTVALLLTREGGGSEQVAVSTALFADACLSQTASQSIVLTQCRGAATDSSKLLTCDKVHPCVLAVQRRHCITLMTRDMMQAARITPRNAPSASTIWARWVYTWQHSRPSPLLSTAAAGAGL